MMYYLLLAVFYPISILPLWISYRISDLAYIIIYYGIGYRKEIVRDNLRHAFPSREPAEIEQIMRRFYKSFCDQWIETIKLLTMSRSSLQKRMAGNWEVLEQVAASGKNVYFLSAHNFNWEWAHAATALHLNVPYAGVYLPVSNAAFDRLMLKIRSRTGAQMISMKGLMSGLKKLRQTQHVMGLLADQNPSDVDVAEWIPFMHREVPVFRGPEQMPRRARAAVAFIGIQKARRGYYKVSLELLTEDASEMGQGDVLRSYIAFVERQLEMQPENYLWSHRRWKHKRKVSAL